MKMKGKTVSIIVYTIISLFILVNFIYLVSESLNINRLVVWAIFTIGVIFQEINNIYVRSL